MKGLLLSFAVVLSGQAHAQFGGGSLRPMLEPTLVVCQSIDRKLNRCFVDGRIREVRLVRQLSDSSCNQGSDWNYDERSIVVTNGCRAQFAVYARPSRLNDAQVLCQSLDRRLTLCPVNGIVDAEIERQLSSSECVEGYSWGITRQGLWTDRGCRAMFRVYTR